MTPNKDATRAEEKHGPRSYAQFREDLGVLEFFGAQYCGRFVDVGANDGVSGSNTYLLEKRGWVGLLIEPSTRLAEACRQVRPRSLVFNKAAVGDLNVRNIDYFEVTRGAAGERFDGISAVGSPSVLLDKALAAGSHVERKSVPADTLNAILDEAKFEGTIDLLSIDVEGYELDVLRGIDLDDKAPKLIIVEDNSFGTDLSISDYLASFGYRRLARSFVNVWYVAPGVDGRPLRLRYPLHMYLDFKLIAAQLDFIRHPGFFPMLKAMCSEEGTPWAWIKWVLVRYSPVFLLRSFFPQLIRAAKLLRWLGLRR